MTEVPVTMYLNPNPSPQAAVETMAIECEHCDGVGWLHDWNDLEDHVCPTCHGQKVRYIPTTDQPFTAEEWIAACYHVHGLAVPPPVSDAAFDVLADSMRRAAA